jgi:hypothetical protein
LSNRLLTYPGTRRSAERQVIRRHHSFRRGVMSDGPQTSVPLDGVWDSENVILYGDRGETRSGTRLLNASHAEFPAVTDGTGISATKSGTTITISSGYTLSASNVGDYFQWSDDGKNELITAVDTGDNSCTVTSSRAHTATTTGRIRQECNAAFWDKINKKHVVLVGSKVYYADWKVTAWTEAYCLSTTAPANAKSIMRQFGDNIYLWNENGKYVIKMSATVPIVERLNNTMMECSIASVPQTEDLAYGRRYTATMIEMLGSYLTNSYEGNEIEHETAPYAIDENGKDFAEVFTEVPIGDESYTYGLLSGGTLAVDPIDFAALSNAQVNITANSETNNVIVDFTGSSTWLDVTDRLQASARDFWSSIKIYFDTDHIVIEMPNAGDTISYCTAGDAGTDISGAGYLNMQTGQGTLSTPTTTESVLIGSLQVPYSEDGGTYTFLQEYTHYRLYATKDVGINGINVSTGKGNNPEFYIHVEDVPIIKSFILSTAADGTATASKGTFKEYDVGSTLYLSDGKSGTITGFTSSAIVTWDKTDVTTDVGATIGSSNAFVFNQSGYAVAVISGTPFDANSVGKRIFISDGTLSIITGYTDSTHVTVADSATRTAIGGGILVSPTAASTANTRKFTDRVSDDKLSTRISKAWCKNRFWEPLPNCNIGIEIDGFFISAVKDGKQIYETQLANSYFAGYYDPEFQIDKTGDSIKSLRVYPSYLCAICSQSTIQWSTEITIEDSRPEVGLTTTFLAQKKTIDYQIGTMFPESIVPVHEGVDILFTNNCEVRLFNGTDYGPNVVEGKMMKQLRKLQPVGAASYDSIGGYLLWGTTGSLTTINSVEKVPFPDICYRFAIREEQGTIGGIKITGNDWLVPPNGVNGYEIIDDGGRALQMVFDNLTAKYYWASTYNGPTGSGLSKTFLDKDDTTGTGTEIDWSLIYGADTGELMKYDIRFETGNLTIDPFNPANADETGYDSSGFRDGLEIDIYGYKKANAFETEFSIAKNIIKDGDINTDETPIDKAIQIKITGNRSECIISEFVGFYTVIDQAAEPSKREMTEGDYQEALASPVLWLTRGTNLYKNSATGASISGTPTGATGVDGKTNSAFQISAALDTITVNLTDGSVLFWSDGTVAVSIDGAPVSLSSGGTSGGWTLYYATGIVDSGILTLTPTGTRKVEDVRVYNSEIDSDTIDYVYNDMVRNNGNNVMRPW